MHRPISSVRSIRNDFSRIEPLERRVMLTAAVDAALASNGLVQFLLTDHQPLTHPTVHSKTVTKKPAVLKAAKTTAVVKTTSKTTKTAKTAKTTKTTTGKKTSGKKTTTGPTTPGIKTATSSVTAATFSAGTTTGKTSGITSDAQSGGGTVTPAAQKLVLGQQAGAPNNTQFHGDAQRTGFNKNETQLNPTNVASSFGQVWQSPVLDGAVYATPIYADSILIQEAVSGVNGNLPNEAGDGIQNASYMGKSLGVAFLATGGGSVYAIATGDTNGTTGIAPGSILWKTHLGNPYDSIDGNSIGVLGTPIIDLKAGRIYVCASVTDYLLKPGNPDYTTYHATSNFEVFALNLSDGSLISGWPIVISQAKLDPINQNTIVSGTGAKVAVAFAATGNGADQRGALNLSADGSTLYTDFACYGTSNPGWMTTIATGVTNGIANSQTPALVSAYSSIDTNGTQTAGNGGMWGAGGPAIDPEGNLFVTTGDTPGSTGAALGAWGNSVLEFGPGQTLSLTGAYTPWNYVAQDTIDSDLGGGSPIIVTLPTGSSTTTDLLAEGGKQGNGYLLDAGNNLNNPTQNPTNGYINNGTVNASYPANLTVRPPTNLQPDQDPSLYDTNPNDLGNPSAGIPGAYRTYFTTTTSPYSSLPAQPGPLALFGPYNEQSASLNTAKARDTPSTFVGPDGTTYVIFNGATKASVGSSTPVAPSVILTKVVAVAGQPAYLQIVAENNQVFANPGAGVITGDGTANEIYWIVDEGAQRGDSTTGFSDGGPMLYAYNATTLQPLWSSAFEELSFPFGKYNSLTMEHGQAIVATNRLQAFGLTSDTIVDDAVTGTGTNQFNYAGSGWTHVTGSSTIGTFDATVSKDTTAGDSATMSFTGSQIKVYADEVTGYGSATYSIDGGSGTTVALTPSVSSANSQGSGDVLVYTASGLSAGTHTLKILNASGTIDVDRVEITPPITTHAALSVSMTDGATVPNPGDVVPYTITFDNAGSILNNTGTAASSVTLNDTVSPNTTFDATNSTAGWTLASGNGTVSSPYVYSFAAGSLPAGQTGSVVFSVDLKSTIPPGTTSVSNLVQISDAAGDLASSTRSTPVPPSAPVKLIFSQQPPSNGGSGLPLSNATTVTVDDQFGNPYTTGNSTVTLTLSSGTFEDGSTFETAQTVNGVATFNGLEIAAAGTYTFTATDGSFTSATSSSIVISNTSKLGFTTQPSNTVAGTPMSNVVVTEEDANGNPTNTADNSSLVTLTLSNHAQFSDGSTTVTQQVSGGAATFTGLTIDSSGDYTLQATDAALTPATSNDFTIGATATHLVFTQQPENTNAGEAINPAMTVAFEDGFGNLDTTQNGSVTMTLNGGGTFFGGVTSETVNAVSGVASFSNVVIPATGNYTLTAAATGETSATSNQFAIGNRTLTHIDDTVGSQVAYLGSHNSVSDWVSSGNATSPALPGAFDGTITTDDFGGSGGDGGDSATFTFNGTIATLYAVVGASAGQIKVFIDGGDPANVNQNVNLANSQFNSGNATQAIAPVFTTPLLLPGSHTLEVLVTGGSIGLDQLVVGPATPTIRWTPPSDLTYGSPLNTTQLDAFTYDNVLDPPMSNFNVPGNFTYTPGIGTVLGVGQGQTLSATFAPSTTADGNGNQTYASDYNGTGTSTLINVVQSTPSITWLGPDNDMFYGQAIGSNQLDATAAVNGVAVQGTFQYFVDDAEGNPTIPAAGVHPPVGENFDISLIFTPKDSVDYATVTADTDVTVDPAVPVLTWANPADIVDGTPLTGTQLDAAATDPTTGNPLPGSFLYSPLAGTILPPGQHQQLGVQFFPTDSTDYSGGGTVAYVNVDYGQAAKLAFAQQPSATKSNVAVAPAVQVVVEDSAGSTIPTSTDSVTLTLSSGTFADGSTTETATAVNGVATFGNLTITNNGIYSLTATTTDPVSGLITSPASSQFNVGASIYSNFNNGAASLSNATAPFTTPFYLDYQNSNQTAGTDNAGNPFFTWTAGAGVGDGDLGSPGGAVVVAAGAASDTDETAVYTPTTISLADDNVHTVSVFVTAASGLNSGDRNQIGFLTSSTGSLNSGYSYISARVLGDHTVVFQSCNGTSSTSTSSPLTPTGTIQAGDWLQLIFSAQETSSGNFNATVSMEDYGQTGVGTPTLVLAPTSTTMTNLTTIGTGSVMYGAFRSGTGGEQTSPLKFDNFAVDQTPHITAYLQAPPTNITAGVPVATPIIVAVEDANFNIIAGDTSTVSLNLTNGTFASSGTGTITATAVDGIATFNNVTINPILDGSAVHGLTLRTGDSASLDASFGPTTLSNPAAKLGFIQPPSNTNAGAVMAPPVTVALQDSQGATITNNQTSSITLTLSGGTFAGGGASATATVVNGVATFNNLVINNATSYTLTPSDSTDNVSGPASSAFTITDVPSTLAFTQQPTGGLTGTALSPAVKVAVEDPAGNVFTSDNSSVVTLTLSGATFAGGGNTATATVSSGVATFGNLVINTAGSGYTLTATDPTVSGSTPSNTFTISNAPVKVGFIVQPASTSAGTPIPAVKVAVQDAGGNTVTTDTSTVTLTLSSGTFSTGLTTASIQAVAGVATFSNLVINTAATGYTLSASDSNASLTHATSNAFNILDNTPAKLAFQSQPTTTGSGNAISPAVTVAVEDGSGNVVATDASTVTLTLTGGTFTGGGTTATATASAGIATFGNLTITALGAYSLTASDSNSSLTHATSNAFAITPAPVSVNFNSGATSFTSPFIVTNDLLSSSDGNTALTWGSAAGVHDVSGSAGGGVQSNSADSVDATAVYTPTTVDLADGQVHTMSEFVTDIATGSGDKPLQIGLLGQGGTNLNSDNDTPFVSARIVGNNTVEFQSANGTGGVTSSNSTPIPAGSVTLGDWLQLVFTTQEVSSGNFQGTFSLLDYGPSGVAAPKVVIAPVSYTASVPALGLGAALQPAFRSQTSKNFTGALDFDNFYVSPNMGTVTVDDTTTGSGTDQITYNGTWTSGNFTQTTGQLPAYASSTGAASNHTMNSGTANATINFTGTEILYYATESSSGRGDVTVKLDGVTTTNAADENSDSLSTSNAGDNIGDVLVYDSGPLTYGNHTLVLTRGSADPTTSQRGISVDRFDIIKGNPSITWANPAAITYGTALSATQLNATATFGGSSLAGTFVYNQPVGTVLSVGTQTLSGMFVPSATSTYSEMPFSSTITVNPAGTTTTVSSNATPSASGQAVTFTATVAGTLVPTGTVQFKIDGANVGSPVTLVGGSATSAAISNLAAGTHSVVAVYTSDNGNFQTSTSTTFSQTVLPGWLSISAGANVVWNQAAETLQVNSGTATILADPGEAQFNGGAGDSPVITVNGSGTSLIIAPTDGSLLVHIGGLSVQGGALADVSSVASRTHSNHRVLVIGKVNQATAPTFSISATSKLNLRDNDMIVHGGNDDSSDFAAVKAAAAVGRAPSSGGPGGTADGTWSGNGLTSSVAAAVDGNAGVEQNILAVELNSDRANLLGQFSAWTVGTASEPLRSDGNDVIVKYTYNGDLNLSGAVDGNAITIISQMYRVVNHVPFPLTSQGLNDDYAYGDLNGDGLVDDTDITIISQFYGNGMPGHGLPLL